MFSLPIMISDLVVVILQLCTFILCTVKYLFVKNRMWTTESVRMVKRFFLCVKNICYALDKNVTYRRLHSAIPVEL